MKITETKFSVFDLETTGTSPERDHIVQLGVSIFEGGALKKSGGQYFRPPVPIAPEATQVHGIRDIDVVSKPKFAEHLPEISKHFDQCQLISGYNCLSFDRVMVDAEAQRALSQWRMPAAKILDVKVFVDWYHRGRKRNLESAASQYGLKADGNLHSAVVDTVLTGNLLLAMVRAQKIPDDVDEAMKRQGELSALVEAEFGRWSYWLYRHRETETLCIGAGKHQGLELSSVPKDYLRYLLSKIGDLTPETRAELEREAGPRAAVGWGGEGHHVRKKD